MEKDVQENQEGVRGDVPSSLEIRDIGKCWSCTRDPCPTPRIKAKRPEQGCPKWTRTVNELMHLDLFSGIGGFSLAFEREGFRTIGFAEIDPYASAVLGKHWPNVINYGDIRSVPAIRCSVITGGFPCQPFSCAGKRRGEADDRYLWPAMLDVIDRCQPDWVLGENVPGILGMGFDQMLVDLEGKGYRCQAFVVPACAVDAPHRRDRVWIVANRESGRAWPAEQSGPRNGFKSSRENVANTAQQCVNGSRNTGAPRRGESSNGSSLANSVSAGLAVGQEQSARQECATIERNGNAFPHTNGQSSGWPSKPRNQHSVWLPEPDVGRVAHGVSARVDRLRCLGNAIVPQVAQVFARAIHEQMKNK